ncbi:type II toxin-antitoxin system Phd/YefM family antitoxin [Angustibacter sp. McL0619]|uniref:type II toxin-antitoxin system Phd/YefM family antitoxin n=1 Tax=Angustibacter sp. McL0619 TaxID=3415676 RepID=UPI003CFA3A56
MTATPDVSISAARSHLAEIVDRAEREHQPVFIARRGRRVAAVISSQDLDRLLELAEDMADIRAAAKAREEMVQTRSEPVPWEDVKADLGLV